MSDENVKQRIQYLVEHGGLYPRRRPEWLPWAVVLVALGLLGVLAPFIAEMT